MRFRLDSWQSDYAFPYEPEPVEVDAVDAVDVEVEAPAHDWAPITPPADTTPFATVRFIDGVQASDAVIWINDPDRDRPLPGLVASWAAGVVSCSADGAALDRVVVERGVFSDARSLGPIIAGNLTWRPQAPETPVEDGDASDAIRDPDPMALRERLGLARRRLEDRIGILPAPDGQDVLTVYDGLLHARSRPLAAVGLAKRAHRIYLPESLQGIQRQLTRGERTPLFTTDAQRRRLSFYLALSDPLPPAVADPGSCVARIELSVAPDTAIGDVSAFADRVAATLPPFASEPHVDPRAPQNLMPIRSLERELRRLLGRPSVVRPLLASQAAESNPS